MIYTLELLMKIINDKERQRREFYTLVGFYILYPVY